MVLNSSEMASNLPWTSVLIFCGIPELIVLTLVVDLALTNVYIPLRDRKTGDHTSEERKYWNRINNLPTRIIMAPLTPSYSEL
jgi:hypothetical protein